ncbi:type I-B CRISPR-associated endonuclease Cas1b [Flammeovirga sp. EKP202]|uniref:type I-B CRISPR-associated endonuclease Cas1b n=1 Tax=Flammeovirga sp. EKP202 TaxID=2770592 RepID=UPI00165F265D|nr:type I-B CRISPR-associated endonuclease Cas1b [Flammeovirga sp. EKP202]MBD0402737.1 type I-B CRISPR-associated endonuclease Cas1 [Flammeovirga sp. EKP202]
MKKSYYLFNPGRLSRKDNTLKFVPVDENGREGQARYLPVEQVGNLYVLGSLDANSALYNFLGKNGIGVHFFDYYEHYTGSFYPKEYLQAGQLNVQQSLHYADSKRRIQIAQAFIDAASFNMLKTIKYYHNRGKDLTASIFAIEEYRTRISSTTQIDELMGLEGNIRQSYYSAFTTISPTFPLFSREKRPPTDPMNALISFSNMLCYTACLDMIYHTQLDPTISFLHEPGVRRFSLALDLAEVFKPVLVDRMIFSLVNKGVIQHKDFNAEINACLLKESGRKKVLQAWDKKLTDTIKHRSLGRNVSYKHLIKLECYKVSKHLMDIEPYIGFKCWW